MRPSENGARVDVLVPRLLSPRASVRCRAVSEAASQHSTAILGAFGAAVLGGVPDFGALARVQESSLFSTIGGFHEVDLSDYGAELPEPLFYDSMPDAALELSIQILLNLGMPRAVRTLRTDLVSPRYRSRLASAVTLGSVRPAALGRRGVEELLTAVRNGSQYVSSMAAAALYHAAPYVPKMHPGAPQQLRQLVMDRRRNHGTGAILALGRTGAPQSAELLLDMACDGRRSERVRCTALRALGEAPMVTDEIRVRIVQLAAESDMKVRSMAFFVLTQHPVPLDALLAHAIGDALGSDDFAERQNASYLGAQIIDPGTPLHIRFARTWPAPLRRILAMKPDPPDLWNALFLASQLTPRFDFEREVRPLARHADPDTRLVAIGVARKCGLRWPEVLDALRDEHELVRLEAAMCLASQARLERGVIPYLFPIVSALSHEQPGVRASAAAGLAAAGKKATAALRRVRKAYLGERNPLVTTVLVRALREIEGA